MCQKICVVLLSCMSLYFGYCQAAYAKRTILIMAATSELGESICDKLAQKGDRLILAGRTSLKLETLKKNLERKYGGTYEILLFNYKDLQSIQDLSSEIKGSIDGLVLIHSRPPLPTKTIPSPQEWQEAINECFIAPLECIRVLAHKFNPVSSIVVISGLTSVYYMPEYSNTNVLRVMWTAEIKNLVTQLSPQKIRVNGVSPGVILTQRNIQKIQKRAQGEGRSYEIQLALETHETPSHQYGQPEDVAESVVFLLSKESKHVNGINLVLDGGLSRAY
jgi:3-oxoacyl-[acyl-carrier protein] reductase